MANKKIKPSKPKAASKPKRKAGRPLKVIDMDLVAKLAHIQCTDEEISCMVGMTAEGFCRRKERDAVLSQCLENGRREGRMSLRRVQWKAAQAGNNTMLVWLGKQYLGQRDQTHTQQEISGPDGGPVETKTESNVATALEQYGEIIREVSQHVCGTPQVIST